MGESINFCATSYEFKFAKKVKGNRKYYRRVYEATIPLRYRILIDFVHLKGKESIEYKDPKEIVTELRQYIRGKSKSTRTWLIYKAIHRNLNTLEGTANISSKFGRTLFVSIGDYYLHFDVK